MADPERQQHIQFQSSTQGHSAPATHGLPLSRHGTQGSDALSIRAASGRAVSTDRQVVEYRTLSVQIDDPDEKAEKEAVANKGKDQLADELSNIHWHTMSPKELYQDLGTNPDIGLNHAEVQERLSTYGPNVPSPPPSILGRKIFMYCFGGFGALLLTAGILCIVAWKPLGDPPAVANVALGIVLIVVFIIQALFNAWQDFSSSRVMASIKTMLPDDCLVLRNGVQAVVHATGLVPGDVLMIRQGNKVPVDARIVESSVDLKFDRSILTGESKPLQGTVQSTDENYLETKCITLQGTHCVSGSAVVVCVATGDNTVFGRIAKLSSRPRRGLTPLQWEVLRFVLALISLIILVIVVVLILWGSWIRKVHPGWMSVSTLIVDCVSVAVAFIPEGLPIALTTCLTITAYHMKLNKVLCKSLATVETLGSVSLICSDKTGTLTKNQMHVTDFCISSKTYKLPIKAEEGFDANSTAGRMLHVIAGICNAGQFDASTMTLPIPDRKINGDATDQAILRMAEMFGPVSDLYQRWKKVHELPFNSKNKFMLTVAAELEKPKDGGETKEASDKYMVMMKGAPDILIHRCTKIMLPDGVVTALTPEWKEKLQQLQIRWALEGKRVLLLANDAIAKYSFRSDPGTAEFADEAMSFTNRLTVVGLEGIVDPPREEIPNVITTLRGAGIRTFMVTGDFKLTASSIARTCNILTVPMGLVQDFTSLEREYIEPTSKNKEYGTASWSEKRKDLNDGIHETAIILEGPELKGLNDAQWDKLFTYSEIIFARTSPEQKLRIVKEFQKRGDVVGMTGDGVNDAPSLKEADVGIAVGNATNVAIEAADMVLLDNFEAIVAAVRHGRVVFDNLRKTSAYLLPAGSFSEFWPVLLNVVGSPQMLNSFLMIIICCFTDCAGAMTLAYEKPESDILSRGPRNTKRDHLVDARLLLHSYVSIGTMECVASMAMAFWHVEQRGIPFSAIWATYGDFGDLDPDFVAQVTNEASSVYFVTLVVMQWFNLLATRTRRQSIFQMPPIGNRKTQNLYIIPAIIFAIVIVFIFCYIPGLQSVIATTQVPVENWFLPMTFGLGILVYDEVRKFCVRRYPNSLIARVAW
jgi:sodium/potassium-transporting ATPase subunit alpha